VEGKIKMGYYSYTYVWVGVNIKTLKQLGYDGGEPVGYKDNRKM